jgi:hypothetical protein
MLVVAKDLQTQYEKALDSASISRELRPHFRKWLRFYLDFCSKYGHSLRSKSGVPLFVAKLASKNQPEAKRNEASVAVTLYFKMANTEASFSKCRFLRTIFLGCRRAAAHFCLQF